MEIDPRQAYRLHPNAAVRPEPFGALVYHYGNRKLVFLKSPKMVELVHAIGSAPSLDHALEAADVPARSRANYLRALTNLFDSDMIVVREEADATAC